MNLNPFHRTTAASEPPILRRPRCLYPRRRWCSPALWILPLVLLAPLGLPLAVQAQFYYEPNGGTITIMRYTGLDEDVTIPDTINGLPVTTLGTNAFSYCTSCTSVLIGTNVSNIEEGAFFGCTNLTTVTIPTSVTRIGDWAFELCTSFTRVTIPSSVTSLGHMAFYACTGLTNITVPGIVTSFGTSAFGYCTSLATATFGHGIVVIPDSTFYGCTNLTRVTIPNSVTSIGDEAFFECASLSEVSIPNSVTNIGAWVFELCSSLTRVTISGSGTSLGNMAFYYCSSLKGVYCSGNPPGLVGSPVFEGATNATVYYLPGTTGWSSTFGDRPTALWLLPNPLILNNGPNLGMHTNGFGFIISWATNIPVVVEACTSVADSMWSPVSTNILTAGASYFNDPNWVNYPARFYRLRSP